MTEILGCGRTITGDLVAYDIRWDGDLSGHRVLWSMIVSSADDQEVVRLVHERVAGEPAAQYVLDDRSGRREELAPDADVSDDEATVRFPANVVGVAVEWPVWKAVLTVDGEDRAQMVVPLS